MNGPPKPMPTFKNALPALSLFAGKFPMSCSPDLALKRKQVWHLDKNLPTTSSARRNTEFCRMQHKKKNPRGKLFPVKEDVSSLRVEFLGMKL
ncbi:hypothetical protein TNCV_3963271 [Trichonephila clavipes]|nr:hypothetical protein TNCV_3963271 [Trichonephila clavipes]